MIRGAGRLTTRMDERANWPDQDAPVCCDRSPLGGYLCTLEPGHHGEHEAKGTGIMLLEHWSRLPSRVADGRHLFPQEIPFRIYSDDDAAEARRLMGCE